MAGQSTTVATTTAAPPWNLESHRLRLHVRRCRVRTSVRIEDDLGSGVSLFMAEAMRLRTIVGEAETAREAGAAPVLFLLDEILHGTNARDRREATRLVLQRAEAPLENVPRMDLATSLVVRESTATPAAG